MGEFVIKKGNDKPYCFSLKADNGQVILNGEAYANVAGWL